MTTFNENLVLDCEHPRRRPFREQFRQIASQTAILMGSSTAFLIALAVVIGWAVLGPLFHFSDTWQLVINTGTTIVTFLMVFLIQNSQNRDSIAIQLKLDELIRAVSKARNHMIDLEHMSDEELNKIQIEFKRLRECSTSDRTFVGGDSGLSVRECLSKIGPSRN
jgi:low affinity Fe/Cu permease